jgi:hypothetical protein
MCKATYVYVRV